MTTEQNNEGMGFVRNAAVLSAEKPGTRAISARSYEMLEAVDVEAIGRLANNKDTQHMAIMPIGGVLHLGSVNADGVMFIDDILPVPRDEVLLGLNQIPLMVDKQPPVDTATGETGMEVDFGRVPAMADLLNEFNEPKKEDEFVLAIDAKRFIDRLINIGLDENQQIANIPVLNDVVYPYTSFVKRGWCENDPRYLQILPYMVFFKVINGEEHIFVYQRGKGVGESRIAGNCSVGVGGHINPCDAFGSDMALHARKFFATKGRITVNGLWDTIKHNTIRESMEEVRVVDKTRNFPNVVVRSDTKHHEATTEVNGWLYRNSAFFLDYTAGEVEKVHLAMYIGVRLDDDDEVFTNEADLIDVGFVPLSSLAKGEGIPSQMENWTKAIVDSLASTKAFTAKEGIVVMSSDFIRDGAYYSGEHFIEADEMAKIPQEDRWKIGTISRIFGNQFSLYAMNAFMKA